MQTHEDTNKKIVIDNTLDLDTVNSYFAESKSDIKVSKIGALYEKTDSYNNFYLVNVNNKDCDEYFKSNFPQFYPEYNNMLVVCKGSIILRYSR